MPSGPPELHEKWTKAGPYLGGDSNAITYLEKRGWTLHQDWSWTPPEPYYGEDDEEESAVNYLIWEWDYGCIREKE